MISYQYCKVQNFTNVPRGTLENYQTTGKLEDLFNYVMAQLIPSRFNFWTDLIAAGFAIYFNNWILAAWFLAAIPINSFFEIYYLFDIEAEMPPIIYIQT